MQKVDYESFGSYKENNKQPEKIIKDPFGKFEDINICLLYTSDAADE